MTPLVAGLATLVDDASALVMACDDDDDDDDNDGGAGTYSSLQGQLPRAYSVMDSGNESPGDSDSVYFDSVDPDVIGCYTTGPAAQQARSPCTHAGRYGCFRPSQSRHRPPSRRRPRQPRDVRCPLGTDVKSQLRDFIIHHDKRLHQIIAYAAEVGGAMDEKVAIANQLAMLFLRYSIVPTPGTST